MIQENTLLLHQIERLEASNSSMANKINGVNHKVATFKQKVQDNYTVQSKAQRERYTEEFKKMQYECFEKLALKDAENSELRNVCSIYVYSLTATVWENHP